jgi:regulator of replication initiation timing
MSNSCKRDTHSWQQFFLCITDTHLTSALSHSVIPLFLGTSFVAMVEPSDSSQKPRRRCQIAEEKMGDDDVPFDSSDEDSSNKDNAPSPSGSIPLRFRLKTQKEKWTVTRDTLKESTVMPYISSKAEKLAANVRFSDQCDPHYMNRIELVSWYVFFQYCLSVLFQEKTKMKAELVSLREENAKLKSLCDSLRESQSKRHSIDEIQAFKTSIVGNIIVPHFIRDVLFRIGFPSTKVSFN